MRIWAANVTVPVPAGVSTVWREGKGSASWYCPFCWGKVTEPRSGSCIQEYKAGTIILTPHKWFWACMGMGEIIVWLKCFAEENLLFPFWWEQRRAQKCGFFFLLCFPPQASSAVVSGSSAGGKLYPVPLTVILREHILLSIQFKKVQQFVIRRWFMHRLGSLYAPNVITLSNLPGFTFFLCAVALLISCFLIPLLHKPYLWSFPNSGWLKHHLHLHSSAYQQGFGGLTLKQSPSLAPS